MRRALATPRGWCVPLYRAGTVCPGCAKSQWSIGRATADCAFCHTALPLAPEARLAGVAL